MTWDFACLSFEEYLLARVRYSNVMLSKSGVKLANKAGFSKIASADMTPYTSV